MAERGGFSLAVRLSPLPPPIQPKTAGKKWLKGCSRGDFPFSSSDRERRMEQKRAGIPVRGSPDVQGKLSCRGLSCMLAG